MASTTSHYSTMVALIEASVRYGDRYKKFKQQFSHAKNRYEKEKSADKSSGTTPLEQKQSEIIRQLAETGQGRLKKQELLRCS